MNKISFEKMSLQQLIKKQIKTLDQKSVKRVSSYINIYILNKLETHGTGHSFVAFKDHKKNFMNYSPARHINPSKNGIG